MVTDAQVDAALDEFRRQWPQVSPSNDMIRACLEAAEWAAWSAEMEAAPHAIDLLLWSPPTSICPAKVEVGPASTGNTVGPYSSMSRHGYATHWRQIPALPEEHK